MERQIEATQAWVDLCAWQVKNGKDRPADFAMLKVQATRMLEAVAREAAQTLGGASYITGSKVARIYREVRVHALGGGSEELMLDLAGRQLFGGGRCTSVRGARTPFACPCQASHNPHDPLTHHGPPNQDVDTFKP